MGVPVTSYDDFRSKLEALLPESDLFGFVLFDRRPTQRPVASFVQENVEWLSDMAHVMDIFLFMPDVTAESPAGSNPSLEVAALFGITPTELPGLLLFASDLESRGVYLPMPTELFATDIQRVEELLAGVVAALQNCRAQVRSKAELLTCVGEQISHMKAAERRKVFVEYLAEAGKAVLAFPHEFVKALAEAVAKGMIGV